jgi:hypothetical protein
MREPSGPEPAAGPETGSPIDPEQALDELYGAAPEEFTLVRSRLERELRDTGATDAAAELKRRRRPHLAAWAVNQIARRDPDAISELFSATTDLAAAQRAAVGGNPDELRDATRRRQDVLDELTNAAVRVLSGHAPKPAQYRDNVAATLDAATLDEAAAVALRSGQLTQPLMARASFGPLDPATIPGSSTPTRRRPSSREVAKARREVAQAQRAADAAQRAADDADAGVTSAELATQSAQSHLEEVDRARERARESLAGARSALTDAQEAAAAARRGAREARARLEEAEARQAALARE